MGKSNVKVIASGTEFVGNGIRSIEGVMHDIVSKSRNEIWFVTFNLGIASDPIIELFNKCLERGVTINLVANHFDDQPKKIIKKLMNLVNRYSYFNIYDFNREGAILHAKIVVVDGSKAIVGSANLSYNAMVKNHEMALLVDGNVVTDIVISLKRLIRETRKIT